MLRNKATKSAIAGILSLAMAASGAVSTFAPLALQMTTASAGEELGQVDFNKGAGLPWHVCESMTGKLKFDISGGAYNIEIVNPGGTGNGGEDRWDCQFRHRGLTIQSGHTYRITYSVKASNSGHMYAKIGNMVKDDQELWHGNGTVLNMQTLDTTASQADVEAALKSASPSGQTIEYGQGWDNWKNVEIPANKWVTYAYEFQPTETVEGTAEYTFHFGGTGQYTEKECFPAGTTLQFDNMAIIDITDDQSDYVTPDPYVRNEILVNQLGYTVGLEKKATMVDDSTSPKTFEIKTKDGETVYTGKSTPMGADAESGDSVHILDFSDFNVEAGEDWVDGAEENGAYYIECDGKKSYRFNIAGTAKKNWLYDGMLSNALNYYYQNRSGIDVEAKYITSGDPTTLAHKGGHNPDVAYIQTEWIKAYKGDGSDIQKSNGTLDVTGGWYDAGDHGKYVLNGGISVWTLQNMYERELVKNGNADKFGDGSMVIPENSNGTPDLLDETKVEMDFFLKMQREDGMVYHKMHDYKWTGLAVRPTEDTLTRIVKPVTTAATLNLAAAAAQGYRLWKDVDSSYADTLLAAAKKAYTAAKANPDLLAPLDQAIGGGAYGDTYVDDDFYWAACELYASTKDTSYYNDLKGYANPNDTTGKDKAFSITTNLTGGENSGSKTSFNWGCTSGCGTLTLSLYPDLLSADENAQVKSAITAAADEYIDIENSQGYGIPYKGTSFTDETNAPGVVFEGYEWGSNSMVVNNAIVMAYAADLSETPDKYANGVVSAMDYVFGRNPLEYSYVTGYGEHHTTYPHHRYWSWILDKSFPLAPAGVLSGGPNSGMQDPWIKGAGYKVGELAPQLCYLDHVESWSTNEVTINWNAPFAWLVSYMEDYKPTGATDPDNTTTTTTTTTTTSTSDTTTTTSSTSGTTSGSSTSGSTGDRKPGDVNCDGKVNIADLFALAQNIAALSDLTEQGKANADVTGDGKVNIADLFKLAQYIAQLIDYSELK